MNKQIFERCPHSISHLLALISTAICLLLSLPSQAQPLTLTPFKVTYAAEIKGIPLTATRTLKQTSANSYKLQLSASAWLSSLEEQSQFHLNQNGRLTADFYHLKRKVFGRKKTEQIAFTDGNASIQLNDEHKILRLKGSHLDKISLYLQLRQDLKAEKNELVYQVVDRGHLKQYTYRRVGFEKLNTPSGPLEAIKLERVRHHKRRQTWLWFAPGWDYLLVGVRQKEEGQAVYELMVKNAQVGGMHLALPQ